MVRLVQKCAFIKAGGAGGYMKYIATRDGVEKIVLDGPISKEQQRLILDILKLCPDSKELFEYADYTASPSRKTASAFLSMAIDANAHDDALRAGYMKYIATRPRAERHGGHGLFSSARDINLTDAVTKLDSHHGNIWTIIYSLRREDAARLGYDNAESWRSLLCRHQADFAENLKIPMENLQWYAAFHNEGHHPHIHMMLWSDQENGYLTQKGVQNLRSLMTKDIFKDDLLHLYERKDVSYKELVDLSRERMKEIAAHVRDASVSQALLEKLAALSEALKSVTGKKQYGYLTKPLKAMVDSIVDELAELPEIRDAYEAWNEIKDELDGYYYDRPRQRLPLRDQKEFRAIKNAIVREVVRLTTDEPEQRKEPTAVLHQQPVSNAVHADSSSAHLMQAGTRLLEQIARIFRSSVPDQTPLSYARVDSKRRRKLLEKRLALGHNIHDHELADNEPQMRY